MKGKQHSRVFKEHRHIIHLNEPSHKQHTYVVGCVHTHVVPWVIEHVLLHNHLRGHVSLFFFSFEE